ncbi:MAG: undecaprenyl-phosphate glucose phosphotransferase [Candidatus Sedimenticola sp. 20ELBAFRAG]
MQPQNKPLLQSRNTTFSSIQASLDALLIICIVNGFCLLKFGYLPLPYVILCVMLLVIMVIVYDRLGIYRARSNFTEKTQLLKAWSISVGILLALGFLSKTSAIFSRQFLVMLFVAGGIGQVLLHIWLQWIYNRLKTTQEDHNALLIGNGQLADYLYRKINDNPWINDKIIGTVATQEDSSVDQNGINPDLQPRVLGSVNDVMQLVNEHNIRSIYIAVPLDSVPIIEEIYYALIDKNVDVHWAPNIFALNLINHSVKELSGIPIITLSESPLVGTNLLMKSLEDRILSLLALILLSPLMLLAALAVKLDSPGPVFFRQPRTGWDGRNFHIWKFRSMRIHEPEEGYIKQATKEDPRITRTGRFLRRTSIDELPQLFNVLDGSMSLVGPRPHAISHNEEYSKRIEAYLARHRIKPGITGLAQVRGYRGETKELDQMIKRVESDLEYINNWSIWLDFTIMVRTVLTLFNKNAY